MRMLHKICEFNAPVEDLIIIYIQYIRSVCEQSCTVWHSSLTQENIEDLERVQKSCLKTIYKENYMSYEHALRESQLDKLADRREELCLKFAQKCVKNSDFKNFFPENPSNMKSRYTEKYNVLHANTDRLRSSSILYMQRLLNNV